MPVKRKRGNRLEKWEVALVKAMIERGGYNDQDILAFFTRPTRSINHARISEIRKKEKYAKNKPATGEELDTFLNNWPNIDEETGLRFEGDELLIKAREAMIAAVHTFNGAGLTFKSELFIVTAIIAWTYLLHAWFRREGIDYRYRNKDGTIKKTKQGADTYWELGKCIKHAKCPISNAEKKNLEFLLELRHEIEHRSTNRIDDTIGWKLQACCINFNRLLCEEFGQSFNLDKRLPIALQFSTFDTKQRELLKNNGGLPPNIAAFYEDFEDKLPEEIFRDPAYNFRVAFIQLAANRSSSADKVVEFIKAGTKESEEIEYVLLKEVDKNRYTSSQVWKHMQENGYPSFNQTAHTRLWQQLDGKNPGNGYGKPGDYKHSWVWNDRWLERVRTHCEENKDKYR